jgi:hypothetical protein
MKVWGIERGTFRVKTGFVNHLLLGSWTEKESRKRTQVKYVTFKFLGKELVSYLKIEDICLRIIVPVQKKVTMSLHRLYSGDGL